MTIHRRLHQTIHRWLWSKFIKTDTDKALQIIIFRIDFFWFHVLICPVKIGNQIHPINNRESFSIFNKKKIVWVLVKLYKNSRRKKFSWFKIICTNFVFVISWNIHVMLIWAFISKLSISIKYINKDCSIRNKAKESSAES